MAQLHLAIQSNQRHIATLDEAELNQWILENLAIASSHEAQLAGVPVPIGHEATVPEVRSAMKDIRMHLMGNQLRAYARFVMHGKEVSLQLDGSLETQDGYIRLRPTSGKIGSLPIPSFASIASCMSYSTRRKIGKSFSCPTGSNQFVLKIAAS